MVGHTHEDIDAAFSVIAEKLRTHEAETLPELLDIVSNCEEIGSVFDVRGWVLNYINKITKHTRQLHFRFTMGENGEVQNLYKSKLHTAWKTMKNILIAIPPGNPKTVSPLYQNLNLENIKKALKSWECLFAQYSWWETFLASIDDRQKTIQYPWVLNKLPRLTHIEVAIPESINNLLQAEEMEHEVRLY